MTIEERVAQLESRLDSLSLEITRRAKAHNEIHEHQQVAIDTAKSDVDRRLHDMNNIRAQLMTQSNTFVSRETSEVWRSAYDTRVRALENRNANLDGKLWAGGALVIIVVTLISGAFRFIG